MSKVLLVVAPEGFRDEELFFTREELEDAGHETVIASTRRGTCHGSQGGFAQATVALADVSAADYDAVAFVGGSGARALFPDEMALRLASEAAHRDSVVAAICIAPVILANAGLLRGRRVTAFPSEVATLQAAGAHCTMSAVAVDGAIVTADGPKVAREFGQAIDRLLAVRHLH
jgi:protease I